MTFQAKGVTHVMTKASKRYYSDIKTLIPSKGKYERDLLKNIKSRIIELEDSHENITYSSLEEILGSPTELLNDYYTNVDTEYLLKRLHTTKIVRGVVFIILILAISAFTVKSCLDIMSYYEGKQAYINREIIIIE